jgi:hypothetical protein
MFVGCGYGQVVDLRAVRVKLLACGWSSENCTANSKRGPWLHACEDVSYEWIDTLAYCFGG